VAGVIRDASHAETFAGFAHDVRRCNVDDEPDERDNRNKRLALIAVATLVPIIVTANWRIAAKAGYPPMLSLLTLISPLNVFMLLAFASREWPIERELRLCAERVRLRRHR
jgi:hypothetical protein